MPDEAQNTDNRFETTGNPDAKVTVSTSSSTAAEQPEGKTFSQSDVDRIVQDRLARAERKFADYDQLKKAAAELEERREAEKSELEKVQGKLSKAQERATGLEQQLRSQRVQSAVLAEAGRKSIVDPEAAYKLLDRDAIEYDEDGSPANIEPLIEQLVQDKPYLTSATDAQGFDGGVREPAPENRSPEEQFNRTTLEVLGLKPHN